MIKGIQDTFRNLYGVTLDNEEATVLDGIIAAYRNTAPAAAEKKFLLPVQPDTVGRIWPSLSYDDFNDACMTLYTYQLELDTDGFVSFCRIFDVVLNETGHIGSLLVNRQVLDQMEAFQA